MNSQYVQSCFVKFHSQQYIAILALELRMSETYIVCCTHCSQTQSLLPKLHGVYKCCSTGVNGYRHGMKEPREEVDSVTDTMQHKR